MYQDIPGTTIFDGTEAQKGLALNNMCFSFNSAENRAAFVKDEDAYCAKIRLNAEQRAAVKSRNVLKMIEAGGNVYYLAKLAGIFGLNVQDIGAQQTGMTRRGLQGEASAAGSIIMAQIIGGIGTTHVPAIGKAIADKKLQQDPYWKPFFEGFDSVHHWLGTSQARCRRGVLQRSRAQFLPRQAADLRDRRRGRISQRG